MPRTSRPTKKKNLEPTPIVIFDFENRTYQIDPERRKVYRRFVEIETAKASQIFSTWRAATA